ncbi:recombinase family protein [Nocardia tengchongensis]|uniref:recombinase family protein n=1 Tax=Nocardia tengchongensis TaxID=2055889 RepID=UPI00369D91CA
MGGQGLRQARRRPEWDNCFEYLRRGDELVLTRLSRPFRSVRHMTELAAQLDERGIDLVVLKQGIDTTTPAGRFPFHIIAAMDEMLADLISEGTREGLESARARGRVGGRPPALTELQVLKAWEMYDERDNCGKRRYTVAQIAETFDVSLKPSTATSNSADRYGRVQLEGSPLVKSLPLFRPVTTRNPYQYAFAGYDIWEINTRNGIGASAVASERMGIVHVVALE